MYKLVVITNKESADGYRLAGVEVLGVESPEEAKKQLLYALSDDKAGVIALDEEFMVALDEFTQAKIEKLYRPVVLPIPSVAAAEISRAEQPYLAEFIRRAIGFQINLQQR
jgi:V/A-type H+-transporting ATPase subunit F